jgi:hypothetical protein
MKTHTTNEFIPIRTWIRLVFFIHRHLNASNSASYQILEAELEALTDDELTLWTVLWMKDTVLPLVSPEAFEEKMIQLKFKTTE